MHVDVEPRVTTSCADWHAKCLKRSGPISLYLYRPVLMNTFLSFTVFRDIRSDLQMVAAGSPYQVGPSNNAWLPTPHSNPDVSSGRIRIASVWVASVDSRAPRPTSRFVKTHCRGDGASSRLFDGAPLMQKRTASRSVLHSLFAVPRGIR